MIQGHCCIFGPNEQAKRGVLVTKAGKGLLHHLSKSSESSEVVQRAGW